VLVGKINLGVLAAAQIVAQHDAIRGSAAQGVPFSGVQGKYFPEALLVAQH
jgi:hypothetical protein